jgi:hypothetical protein
MTNDGDANVGGKITHIDYITLLWFLHAMESYGRVCMLPEE